MKVAFATLGCKVNQAESAAMEGLLRNSGIEIVHFEDQADYYIVNTCSVTGKSDYQSRQMVRRAARRGGRVIATGCYAELKQEELKKAVETVYIVKNLEKSNIVELIKTLAQNFDPIESLSDESGKSATFSYSSSRSRAFLKVQDGCDTYCGYCIVPLARGRSRSIPFTEALEAVNYLASQGYKEIVFTGIHIGRYGRDLESKPTLFDLVNEASHNYPDIRIRLSSIESEEFDSDFVQMIKDERLCPHLHIPLQSGSDTVLKAMNRGTTASNFRELVLTVTREIPNIAIGTDVIAGLPGESDNDFQITYEMLRTLPVSYIHVFPYSPRPGTAALRMKNQVPIEVRKKRAQLLCKLSENKRAAYIASFHDRVLDVIVEDTADKHYFKGLSQNYLKVLVDGDRLEPRQRIKARVVNSFGMYPVCVRV